LAILAVFGAVLALSGGDGSKTAALEDRPDVGDVWFVQDGMLGCSDRKALERVIELSRQRDDEAVKTIVLSKVVTGTCRLLEANSTMYVETVEAKLICGRPRGHTDCLWIPSNGLSRTMVRVAGPSTKMR
jgi:hypothetical protein